MGTRKSNKKFKTSNKRFRRTRSKRQKGGVITRSRKDTSKAKKSTRKTKNKPSKKPPHTEENNELCPICLEIIDNNTDNVTTNCNHTYHRQCLIELCEGKRNNAICPICRENIRDICDLINLHPIMDENINANDGRNLLDELNAEVENEDNREIYTIFEDDDFIEERNRILNEGNIGDIIEYISNGQLNMRYYEINLDEGGNKYFKEVGNMYGFYNNPDHPDYDLYNIEGGKRKTRKTRIIVMGTRKSNRKSKKSKKRFRKTRSKIQRGRGITCSKQGSCIVDRNNITEEENQENLNDLLVFVSQRGQATPVTIILDNGADVNASDTSGSTALMWASENGHIEIVTILLERGANVNAMDNQGWTALYQASASGNSTEIVKMLLDAGANINAQNGFGNTALHGAVGERNIEIIKLLLEKGIDVDVTNNNGITALRGASDNGDPEIVKLLKTYKIEQTNPRHLERQQDRENLAMVMREKPVERKFGKHRLPPEIGYKAMKYLGGKRKTRKTHSKRQRGGSAKTLNDALLEASNNGDTKLVAELLEKGLRWHLDVNTKTNNGNTALMLASEKGHTEIVAMLLDNEADVNSKSNNGWTALMVASYDGHTEIVEMLLKNGADVNTKENDGYTALIIASSYGHTEIVAMLLENGANVNAENNDDGNTALTEASENGHTEIVEMLLEQPGIDVNAKSNNGNTALIGASHNGHIDIVARLLEEGADVNANEDTVYMALMDASMEGHTEIVEMLLEQPGIDVNAKNLYGQTALYWASNNGHPKIVARLLEKGADVTMRYYEGDTVLIRASMGGHTEIVKMLLEQPGIDVNANNDYGATALSFASADGHTEIEELLIRKGVTIPEGDEYQELRDRKERIIKGKLAIINVIATKGRTNRKGMPQYAAKFMGGKRKTRSKKQRGGGIGQSKPPPPPTANEQLLTAINDDNIEGVEIALSIPEVDINNNNGLGIGPPLLYAVDKGKIEIVELLLDNGADIDSIDVSHQTALMVASGMGHFDIVELLLKRGANVNATENDGYTALIHASSGEDGHPEIVKLLLEKGADVNAPENEGYTALIYASQNGHTEIVKMLLDTTKIDVKNTTSILALIFAIENDHHKIVSILLGSGVNPYKPIGNGTNWSAYDTALQQNKHETLRMIGQLIQSQDAKHQLINQVPEVKQKQKIPSLKTLTHRQLPSDAISQINPYKHNMLPRGKLGGKRKSRRKTRLKYGGTKQTQLNNLLIWNISKGNLQMVKLILEKKGDVNMKDEAGDTPLMIAAAYGHEDIVELLLKKGANVNIKNNYGMSVLDAALGYIMMTTKSSKFNNSKLFNLLNDAGAIRGSNFTHIEPTKFTNTGDRLHKITEPGDDQLSAAFAGLSFSAK